jgi:hypothetical protein
MRHLFLLLSVLLLSVSWVAAQNSSPSQKESSHTAAGTQSTVEGCLSSSAGKYTLTDSKGTSYELTGDTSKLAEHVGHEIKVTGTTGTAAASSGSMAASESLEVSSFKHVSKTCKSGGGMSH